MSVSSSKTSYFDVHIDFIGYVNRIREVSAKKGKRGEPFLACDISALNGPSDQPDYCYFSCKVSGRDAQHLIRRCKVAVNGKQKVLIGGRMGDPWIDQFTYSEGHEKAGQPGASLKARLLLINWVKINGVKVYTRPKTEKADDGTSEGGSSAAATASMQSEEAPTTETQAVGDQFVIPESTRATESSATAAA